MREVILYVPFVRTFFASPAHHGRSSSLSTSLTRPPSSSNTAPDLTKRLGPTNTYEVKPYRFFESLDIDLYDCGGQTGFVEGYLTPYGASTLFPFTAALIYVFEVRKLNSAGQPLPESVATFRRILDALLQHAPESRIFILIHKMDLLNDDERHVLFRKWVDTVKETCQRAPVVVFASSIYEDSLFRVRDLSHASLLFTDTSFIGLVHDCTNASSQPSRNQSSLNHPKSSLWRDRSCPL